MSTAITAVTYVLIFGIVILACAIDLLHNRKPPNKYPFKFIFRRFLNWFTVGLTYACTYFGRYNMSMLNTPDVHASLGVSPTQFGVVITVAYFVYAICVVINGFVVDRIGGKTASVIGSFGSSIMNLLMGIFLLFT